MATALPCITTMQQALVYAQEGLLAAKAYKGKGCPSGITMFMNASAAFANMIQKGQTSANDVAQAKSMLAQANTGCRQDFGLGPYTMGACVKTGSSVPAASPGKDIDQGKDVPMQAGLFGGSNLLWLLAGAGILAAAVMGKKSKASPSRRRKPARRRVTRSRSRRRR